MFNHSNMHAYMMIINFSWLEFITNDIQCN